MPQNTEAIAVATSHALYDIGMLVFFVGEYVPHTLTSRPLRVFDPRGAWPVAQSTSHLFPKYIPTNGVVINQ